MLLARRRPAVVLSVGGYAAVPCAVGALVLRVPLVVTEQNAVPGATNRLAARSARAAVPLRGHRPARAVVTGNPVRAEVLAVPRPPMRRADGPRRARPARTAGRSSRCPAARSARRRINQAVRAWPTAGRERGDLAIHHVVGARDWAELAGRADGRRRPARCATSRWGTRTACRLLLAAADVWVGRAGGTTVAELTAVGVPSVLVPLPIAPRDHQTANAGRLGGGRAPVRGARRRLHRRRGSTELDALLDRAGHAGGHGRRRAARRPPRRGRPGRRPGRGATARAA